MVLQLFEWMQDNGRINSSSYSSYIKFMGKGCNPAKALEVFNGIKDEAMKNNVSIWNSVLGCLVRGGKFESSIRLFYQMKQDGLMPDVFTYSTVCHFNIVIIPSQLRVYICWPHSVKSCLVVMQSL